MFFSSKAIDGDFRIKLSIRDFNCKAEEFTFEPESAGLRICGQGRTGVLYGAYEFLRLQGWRWLSPEPEGDCPPDKLQQLKLPTTAKTWAPSFSLGRGFVFEETAKESTGLCLWMARNRMNLSGCRYATGQLSEKLGMSPVAGGHIFASILDPDRILASGRTLWEEHPEWYGLPINGVREKDKWQETQFCISQNGLIQFLGNELLTFLNGRWKNAERIEIWGFDTWGAVCHCEKCQAIGNSADQAIYFLSQLRTIINRAMAAGTLDHEVRLGMCAYEGTATLAGPTKAAAENLLAAGDYLTFYPIRRCYAHDFNHPDCSRNRLYRNALQSWFAVPSRLPAMLGEYYNVSTFEDLPLLFTRRITTDLPAYHREGVRGITYMHLPLVNWGMRTLTQLLYAQLAWDVNTDTTAFLDEYFKLYYGAYASEMRKVYDQIEQSWSLVSQWRSHGASILTQLLSWDGRQPDHPLSPDHHFSAGTMAQSGRFSLELMTAALETINRIIGQEQVREATEDTMVTARARDPNLLPEWEMKHCRLEKRLSEDRRQLLYGIDVMTLMTDLVVLYDMLYHGERARADLIWTRLDRLATKMDSYYLPISYDRIGVGLVSKDALTRSQLRDCIRRCRKYYWETHSEPQRNSKTVPVTEEATISC